MGVNLNGDKQYKYRETKAGAAFQLVRRLSRLQPSEKTKLVVSLVLAYGSVLH